MNAERFVGESDAAETGCKLELVMARRQEWCASPTCLRAAPYSF
jgi:hypothetical protein